MNQHIPVTRDFNLNYSIEEVKKSIELICELSSSTFTIKSKNDAFNSYTMTMVGGLTVVNPQIQLKKVSEQETNLVLTCNFKNGNTIASTEIIDKFFVLVGKSLTGENIDKETIAKEKAGCFTIIIGIVGIGSPLVYYLFS